MANSTRTGSTGNAGDSVVVNVRMSLEERGQLDDLARATGRSRGYHIAQAIAAYIDEQRWQIAHIQKGISDADAGRLTPHADVMAYASMRETRTAQRDCTHAHV